MVQIVYYLCVTVSGTGEGEGGPERLSAAQCGRGPDLEEALVRLTQTRLAVLVQGAPGKQGNGATSLYGSQGARSVHASGPT